MAFGSKNCQNTCTPPKAGSVDSTGFKAIPLKGKPAKYRHFFLKNMRRDYFDLKNQLMDTLPAEIDVDKEIKAARELVDSGKGVPNVPPFGAILSKMIPKETVNACLQVQAGLRINAITNEWEGSEKIIPARIFDTDPKELNMVQSVLNNLHENYLLKLNNGEQPTLKTFQSLSDARLVSFMAISNARDQLIKSGNDYAAENLNIYIATKQGMETTYSYNEAFKNYFTVAFESKLQNIPPKIR